MEKRVENVAKLEEQWREFATKVETFRDFGTSTRCFDKRIAGLSVPFYVNEFWTSKQRAAHSLHEVSYRACFKPQLPRFFVERLTQPGAVVYDPFMGRGTTLLESALLQRVAMGNDVNPLSKILCEPRLDPPTLEQVERRLGEMCWHCEINLSPEEREDLAAFYHSATLEKLVTLRGYILEREASGTLDKVDKWIRMVATNRLTGHSPGFFSVYSLPPNQAVKPDRQRIINARYKQQPTAKDIPAIILKKSKSLLAKLSSQQRESLADEKHLMGTAEADSTAYLENDSVDLVVTSPPFLDVVDYRSDNWLRCWFNGIDAEALPISQMRGPEQWVEKMSGVMEELKRVLKPTGLIAFEVGEVKGGKVLLEELVAQAGLAAGLSVRGVLINDQKFTKTANCWGVDNQAKGTNTNRIVMLSHSQRAG